MPRTKKTEDGENSPEKNVVQQQEGAVPLGPVPEIIKVYFDSMKAQMDGLYAAMTAMIERARLN